MNRPDPRLSPLALAVSLILVSACAPTPDPAPAPGIPLTGMANPAAVSCIDNGGQLQIRSTPTGDFGICVLPDGRQCEEWALFRDHRCVAP
tara:strand:+ start:1463 stop:1735 length:273 start_codon:yes stop_codon:yes gene_type:complete